MLNPILGPILSMPCFYPEGAPEDWCERHAAQARASTQKARSGASA